MKYEAAIKELETIVRQMENDQLDIDTLGEQLKRAQALIKFCRDKLTKTDEKIKSILADS
ncbi:MAG: exodeoxyribonuclease VII small subunit [Prevotella sp.]|nr:exodeoxyribonuclease VII small subunit [Prevotella sp.]